jgi:uridine kinase
MSRWERVLDARLRIPHDRGVSAPASPEPARSLVLAVLAERILALDLPHPTRVAVDGYPAASGAARARRGRPVARVALDSFKRPWWERPPEVRDSPEEYYRHSFDLDRIRDALLLPLGPGGTGVYRTALVDQQARRRVAEVTTAAPDAVLVADGVFALRPELVELWDFRIWLDVDVEHVLARGPARDLAWMESLEAATERYVVRYVPGEALYTAEADPISRADAVVDNRDFAAPRLLPPR